MSLEIMKATDPPMHYAVVLSTYVTRLANNINERIIPISLVCVPSESVEEDKNR